MPSVKFVVKDYAGKPHEYETTLFPPSVGTDLYRQITAAVSEPLIVAMYEFMRIGGFSAMVKAAQNKDVDGAIDLSDEFCAPRIGASLRTALAALPTPLVRQLLASTTRDHIPLVNITAYDSAYTANYAELSLAVWEVVNANRFLSFMDILQQKIEMQEADPSGHSIL